MSVGDVKCQDKVVDLREDLWEIWDSIPRDGNRIPTITENQERAYRQGMRLYGLLVGEYSAAAGKDRPDIVINLNEISTEELKRRLAEKE